MSEILMKSNVRYTNPANPSLCPLESWKFLNKTALKTKGLDMNVPKKKKQNLKGPPPPWEEPNYLFVY